MPEFGLFNDESTDWSEEEAVEAGFSSREQAEVALRERYDADDELVVHEIEEPGDEDEDLEEEEETDDDQGDSLSDSYPTKY